MRRVRNLTSSPSFPKNHAAIYVLRRASLARFIYPAPFEITSTRLAGHRHVTNDGVNVKICRKNGHEFIVSTIRSRFRQLAAERGGWSLWEGIKSGDKVTLPVRTVWAVRQVGRTDLLVNHPNKPAWCLLHFFLCFLFFFLKATMRLVYTCFLSFVFDRHEF